MDSVVAIGQFDGENEKKLMDMGRWLHFHRCDLLREKGSNVLYLSVPLSCVHLRMDRGGLGATCKIYDKRPELCKAYLCDIAKEEVSSNGSTLDNVVQGNEDHNRSDILSDHQS